MTDKNREDVIVALQLVLKGAGLYTGEIDGIWGPKCELAMASLTAGPESETFQSKGSWYSQYRGKYVWIDTGDKPNSNALGVPDDQQGIALYDRNTLGDWFQVTSPNGVALRLQQTDIGPHPSTGRKIDIAAVAAERFGYSPKNFPTDSIFTWKAV